MYVNPLALCQAHHQDSKFGQQYYYLVITINFKELEPFGVKKKKRDPTNTKKWPSLVIESVHMESTEAWRSLKEV